MLLKTVDHLIRNVIPTPKEYDSADKALSVVGDSTNDLALCASSPEAREANHARRR